MLRGVLLALVAAAFTAARWFPFGALPSLCWFRRLSGVPCPACGMTRAWVHLAHGAPGAAWAMNPLGAALAVLAAASGAWLLLRPALPAPVLLLSDKEAWALRMAFVAIVAANWAFVLAAGRA